MLVGHMPSLPRLLALLLGQREDGAADFPLHGLVALEAAGDLWKETWRIESR
jgi:phosphohistidine phosphatase SixA